jgi:hypothetical protein
MLIAGVNYIMGPQGMNTVLRLVGVTAYDRVNEASRKRGPHERKEKKPLDASWP